ncbi:MAG: CHASE2 domain-containing protein [Elainellaceae cyanobacterium]
MQGTLLDGRYKIIRVLGAGGFGQTYLAEDIQRPEISPCVIKQFKPASQDAKFLKIARRLFDTEVETLERLGQHDQIPSFYGSFEEDQEFYLVQEFVDGLALSDELDRIHHMTEPQVVDLLRDILPILEFVHEKRVIHRDIKPENLIRRYSDRKFVLIDFGAVKEIRTQVLNSDGQTQLTVGIGTEGYTPSEQLAGKPRYCSDIYALGIMAIQALTGYQPYQLREDLDTGELLWREYTATSVGLALILDGMIRFHFSNRYQSAIEVLKALDMLATLPTDMTDIPEQDLYDSLGYRTSRPPSNQLHAEVSWKQKLLRNAKAVAIATVAVFSSTVVAQYLGWFQRFELVAYDRMVQLSPDRGVDSRLLIVGIDEDTLTALQRGTPSDESVAQVIGKLQELDARLISMVLYRNIGEGEGREQLLQELNASNVIAMMNLGTSDSGEALIPPPPGLPSERVGFNDFPIDADGKVRRSVLIGTTAAGESFHSLAFQSAVTYLAAENIDLINTPGDRNQIQLGETPIPRLDSNAGGYSREDVGGYQIMLDYRSAEQPAPVVSFAEVLNGTVDPELVRDRIVLIGTIAESSRDFFPTPYSAGRSTDYEMSGVEVHAQMLSQILSLGMGDRALRWYWPEWGEMLWILGWTVAGGVTAIFLRHPVLLGIGTMSLVLVISGSAFFIFSHQGWIPVVMPAIAAVATGGAVVAYRAYTTQKDNDAVTRFLRQNRAETSVAFRPLSHELDPDLAPNKQSAPKANQAARPNGDEPPAKS